jgi:hypothetical protein
MKLNDLAIDPEKLEKGDWVTNIPDMGELRLRVRGIGNADFRGLQAKLIDAEPRQFKIGGRLSPERQDAIQTSCLLATVLMDWDGLQDEHGNRIPYSKEMAKTLLTDPAYRRFRDGVTWAASVVAEITKVEVEEDGKNSPKPSDGS